jgi:hypothetical protein
MVILEDGVFSFFLPFSFLLYVGFIPALPEKLGKVGGKVGATH